MIASGDITLDGHRVLKATVPKPGSLVEIWRAPFVGEWLPAPDAGILLDVHYEDKDMLVVEKPADVPSVPLHPEEKGTLANAVVFRFPECAGLFRKSGDGGLLQRLDKETSGAVMAARSQTVFDALVKEQKNGRVEKHYVALVRSTNVIPDIIDTPLAVFGRRRRRMIPSPNGLPACTKLSVLDSNGEWSLVEAVIHRGVRHQIRAHLASIGTPIAGDQLYGDASSSRRFERLFLHAYRLLFTHPRTGKKMSVTAPLSKELSKFVEKNLIISF
jgi:23S rRNA pseudouridine1911/1915/1917 synthase